MPKKQVADNIVDTNKSDIYTKREQLKQINRIRGEDSSIINIQSDGMYNNALYSGIGKTAFQPATQGFIRGDRGQLKHGANVTTLTTTSRNDVDTQISACACALSSSTF